MSVGLIGAGGFGQKWLHTLKKHHLLAGIAEISAQRRTMLTDPSVEHWEALYAQGIRRFIIATPVPTHFSLARELLEAGCDILVEKPLCFSAAQGEILVELAHNQQCILMVGHLLLYQPAIPILKQFLEEKRLGTLYNLHLHRCNLGTRRTHENVLYSFGVHDIALLDYLFKGRWGEIEHAHAQCLFSLEIVDTVIAHLHIDALIAHCHWSWHWHQPLRTLRLFGEKGALILDELQHRLTYYPNYLNAQGEKQQGEAVILCDDPTPPLDNELMHFIQATQERTTPWSNGHQGVRVLKQLHAIQECFKEFAYESLPA